MNKQGSIPEIDPLLRPFLQSSDDAECERLLAGLVSNQAPPLIKEAIWFKLRALSHSTADGVQHQEAEDIHSEAILHLVGRLRDLQADPGLKPINNFRVMLRLFHTLPATNILRRKYPLRHGLKTECATCSRISQECRSGRLAENSCVDIEKAVFECEPSYRHY